ncbi:MAG TPA: hypothetical protein VLB44_26575 [Kofleriaceae bacterium]|nr:hypothetical protein [Kofleriaceae bacterium]
MSAADDDAKKLAEISRELPLIDIDDASAQRIAHIARQSVGRGPSPKRFIEPVLVGVLALSVLVWAILKLVEVLR